jgi:hypothetical protein
MSAAPRVPSALPPLPGSAMVKHHHPAHCYIVPRTRLVQAELVPCAAALERLREAAKQARGWLQRAEAPAAGVAELRVLEALAAEAGATPSVVQPLHALCHDVSRRCLYCTTRASLGCRMSVSQHEPQASPCSPRP